MYIQIYVKKKRLKKELEDKKDYRTVNFDEKITEDLTESSIKRFKYLRKGGLLPEKQLSTKKVARMAEFVFKKNFFEFNFLNK